MGDLVGQAVEGTIYYAPKSELNRVAALQVDATKRVALLANLCRFNALYMIARAGSGHIGSSFSSMEIMSWLFFEQLKHSSDNNSHANDVFFSSKGHDAPGYYSVMMGAGKMDFEYIHQLRKIGGLPGHPDIHTPGIETNTGSLGMGISKAKGMLEASKLHGHDNKVYVLTGDGELQEGQLWESLISAANHKQDKLVVIVDHNKLQSDTFVKNVSDLGDLNAKFTSFGWHVERIDGHDLHALKAALAACETTAGKPHVIIADTIKGKGVSFMEHTALDSDADMYRFHSGAPDAASYRRAAQELLDIINTQFADLGQTPLLVEHVERPVIIPPQSAPQRMIAAYANALVGQASNNPNILALDADLVLDTGLIPFREKFPERFIECGIAEMDMVSQAGGMALKGALPIVHSFACFLSARPNEQIYNNTTEGTHIIYIGSMGGMVPGGPGHSHQAVRDIAALKGNPGMLMYEPATEHDVHMALDYFVNTYKKCSYLRLCTVPWSIDYCLPDDYKIEVGKGAVLQDGSDVAIFAYGPVMLNNAYLAAQKLAEVNISVKVIHMPWLNVADGAWLKSVLADVRAMVTIDNHYLSGGQGETMVTAAAEAGALQGKKLLRLGLTDVPACGTHAEVLQHHQLDVEGVAQSIRTLLNP